MIQNGKATNNATKCKIKFLLIRNLLHESNTCVYIIKIHCSKAAKRIKINFALKLEPQVITYCIVSLLDDLGTD